MQSLARLAAAEEHRGQRVARALRRLRIGVAAVLVAQQPARVEARGRGTCCATASDGTSSAVAAAHSRSSVASRPASGVWLGTGPQGETQALGLARDDLVRVRRVRVGHLAKARDALAASRLERALRRERPGVHHVDIQLAAPVVRP